MKVTQLCPTLCDPMDYTVHEILQARIQPIPSPGDLPNPGVEPGSPALQADSLPIELSWKPFVSKEPINSWDDLITLWNNRGKKNNSLIV